MYGLDTEAKFKVGDKVRVIKHSGYFAFGDVGEVERQAKDVVFVKHGSYQRIGLPIDVNALELVAAPGEGNVDQPKFKAGDKVNTSGVDDAGVGTVLKRNDDGTYQVKFDTWYNICSEAEGRLTLAEPNTPLFRLDTSGFVTRNSFYQPASCIVARVLDGTPRPSNIPYVHPDVGSATTEAERLATNNPGQEFAVYQRVAGRVAEVSYSMKEVA